MIFENKKTIDFREIRRLLARRRALLIVPPVAATVAALAGIFLMEPSYESVATLAIETPVPLTRTVEQATGTRGRGANYAIQTIRKRMRSTNFLESVAIQVGLHENGRLKERAKLLASENPSLDENDLLMRECVASLQKMIEVRPDGSDLFSVRAVSNNPELAYRISETAAEQFIQVSRQNRLQQSEEAYRFARDQMAIYEKELERKRRKLREYEQELALRPLSGSAPKQIDVGRLNGLLTGADADIEFLQERRRAAQQRVSEAGLSSFSELGSDRSTALEALKETYFELERRLARSLVESDESAPAVIGVKTQIAVKSQQLLSEYEASFATRFPSVDTDGRKALAEVAFETLSVSGAKKRKAELQKFLDEYAAELASIPAEEFRLNRLREDVDSADRLYQTWLEQANSTQIAKAVQSASVGNLIALIEPAQLPLVPFAPRKGRMLTLAIVMGLVLGFAAAIVSEYLDLTLKSVSEIEAVLEVPILGAVPRMQSAVLGDLASKKKSRMRLIVVALIATTLALAAAAYYYFLLQNPGGLS